jgi:AraC-like DNA-binding protein
VSLSTSSHIFLNDIRAHRDVRAEPMHHASDPSIVGQVAVEGGLGVELGRGVAAANRSNAVLYRRPEEPAVHLFKAGTRLRSVGYKIECATIERLLDGNLPPALRRLIERDGARPIDTPNSESLRAIARRLFGSGLNGALRRLLIEGLVVQLLVLQVASAGAGPARRRRMPSSRQRTAVREARERLLANLREPPSLGDLAAAVGLTEKQLNAGLRALFGSTAFEILRDERLDQARRALEQDAASLKEISFRVGYDHVSSFVHAFHRRFGAPPRQYVEALDDAD